VIAKIVLLFLLVMGLLGVFGKWRIPGAKKIGQLRKKAMLSAKKCPHCGGYSIGDAPCACRKGKG
jgi:hypothetical protein